MKTRVINITKNKGEIGSPDEFNHNFYGGEITELNRDKSEYFYLDIHYLQEETNTSLRLEKYFETKEDALNYLKKFTNHNPTSEGIIKKITEQELAHYV